MAGHTAEEEGEAAAQREEEEAKKQYTRTLSKVKLLPCRRRSSRNYLLLSPVDDSALDSEDTPPACLPTRPQSVKSVS